MKTPQRKLWVMEDLKPFPPTLKEALEIEGWELEKVTPESLPQRLAAEPSPCARGVLVSLLNDYEHGVQHAFEVRKHDSLRKIPLVVIGGDNEHLGHLKQEIPYTCFTEPGTLHLSLKYFLPLMPD